MNTVLFFLLFLTSSYNILMAQDEKIQKFLESLEPNQKEYIFRPYTEESDAKHTLGKRNAAHPLLILNIINPIYIQADNGNVVIHCPYTGCNDTYNKKNITQTDGLSNTIRNVIIHFMKEHCFKKECKTKHLTIKLLECCDTPLNRNKANIAFYHLMTHIQCFYTKKLNTTSPITDIQPSRKRPFEPLQQPEDVLPKGDTEQFSQELDAIFRGLDENQQKELLDFNFDNKT